MTIPNRIPDKEFVLLSNIKNEIIKVLNTYCMVRATGRDVYPDLTGQVHWLIKEQDNYRMVILIRYVNTSDFEDVDALQQYIESMYHHRFLNLPPYITKNCEELEVVIYIKPPHER